MTSFFLAVAVIATLLGIVRGFDEGKEKQRLHLRKRLLLSQEFQHVVHQGGHDKCPHNPVVFKFNETMPFTYKDQLNGEEPFEFANKCQKTQHCFGLWDDELWNARVAAFGASFPIFENELLPDLSPPDGQSLLENARIMFDEDSEMHIEGVGFFKGPTAIGSYLSVPHSLVSGFTKTSTVSNLLSITDENTVTIKTERLEKWAHTLNETDTTSWQIEVEYYPCSVRVRSLVLKLPEQTVKRFIESALVPGTKDDVCNRLMSVCTGEHQQFETHETCVEYMEALPIVDPICQHKYGDGAVQGNSFMCKYLHQFMAPFEPELHCYHAGPSLFDTAGNRKCAPTDCLEQSTPQSLLPNLLFPKDKVEMETFFAYDANSSSFVETLVEPQVPRELGLQSQSSCSAAEIVDLAEATVLALPTCMPALSSGVQNANCTQALSTYFGQFVKSGALCRCSSSDAIQEESVMLTQLRIDPFVLLRFASASFSVFKIPSCIGDQFHDVIRCGTGSYLGERNECYEWDYGALVNSVYRDWSPERQFRGRITKTDAVASAECIVLATWQRAADSRWEKDAWFGEVNQVLPGYHLQGAFVHPSLGPAVMSSHDKVLEAIRARQRRSPEKMGPFNTCFFGAMNDMQPRLSTEDGRQAEALYSPVAYSDDDELRTKVRQFVDLLFPGIWKVHKGPLSEILDKVIGLHGLTRDELRSNLDEDDIVKVINEITFRVMLEDKIPYNDADLGDNLHLMVARYVALPDHILSRSGYVGPASYKAARDQVQRIVRETGVIPEPKMEEILEESGLLGLTPASGSRSAYDLFFRPMIGERFAELIRRVRYDECKVRHLWEEAGPRSFILEHLRLIPRSFFAANADVENSKIQTVHVTAANMDPSVFEDPLKFNPHRTNLHQAIVFNGLEAEFDMIEKEDDYPRMSSFQKASSTKRGCPGRNLVFRMFQELAPMFFPDQAGYTCHGGIRVRYGVQFDSELVTVKDGVELEVLKVRGSSKSKTLMIMLHGEVDVPVGWAKFISKMKDSRNDVPMDYWSLVMPGWGEKATPLEQCEWPRVGGYVADFLRHARQSYDRIFLFGRGEGGYVAQYAANEVGKGVLYGLVTDALPPAVYAVRHMTKPLQEFYKASWLDPILSDLVLASDQFPLEKFVENATWWDATWEYDFRSFQKNTGGSQITCQTRSNWAVGPNGHPKFNDFDAARNIDPDMHMLTIGHEFSLLQPENLVKIGLKQVTPRSGIVQVYQQVRSKPDMKFHYYDDEGAEELADIVSSFVVQSLRIRNSISSRLTYPPDFKESAYVDEAYERSAEYFLYMFTVIIMTSGIVAELTIGPMIVRKGSWAIWLFSQVIGATLFSVCALAADLVTVPLWVIGLFKLGYPEVTGAIVGPIKRPEFFFNSTFVRIVSFFGGIAYIIHHTGGTIVYLALCFHLMQVYRVGVATIPLAFQHLSVIMKYTRLKYLHLPIILALEVWFQIETYYLLTYATKEVKVGFILLLASHYIWFVQGAVVTFYEVREIIQERVKGKKEDKDNFRGSVNLASLTKSLLVFESLHDPNTNGDVVITSKNNTSEEISETSFMDPRSASVQFRKMPPIQDSDETELG